MHFASEAVSIIELWDSFTVKQTIDVFSKVFRHYLCWKCFSRKSIFANLCMKFTFWTWIKCACFDPLSLKTCSLFSTFIWGRMKTEQLSALVYTNCVASKPWPTLLRKCLVFKPWSDSVASIDDEFTWHDSFVPMKMKHRHIGMFLRGDVSLTKETSSTGLCNLLKAAPLGWFTPVIRFNPGGMPELANANGHKRKQESGFVPIWRPVSPN